MAAALLVDLVTTGLCAVPVPLPFPALNGQAPGAPRGASKTPVVAKLPRPVCPGPAHRLHHRPVPPPFVPRPGRWPSRDPSQHARWPTGQGEDEL